MGHSLGTIILYDLLSAQAGSTSVPPYSHFDPHLITTNLRTTVGPQVPPNNGGELQLPFRVVSVTRPS